MQDDRNVIDGLKKLHEEHFDRLKEITSKLDQERKNKQTLHEKMHQFEKDIEKLRQDQDVLKMKHKLGQNITGLLTFNSFSSFKVNKSLFLFNAEKLNAVYESMETELSNLHPDYIIYKALTSAFSTTIAARFEESKRYVNIMQFIRCEDHDFHISQLEIVQYIFM